MMNSIKGRMRVAPVDPTINLIILLDRTTSLRRTEPIITHNFGFGVILGKVTYKENVGSKKIYM